ncbi:MAG: twin-arginine translocase TatA/TatE family subunit [Chloroflexi bacterium]|nr:twin-arginine translocase TatA/TatE family subunit [Chloroflexota bacterium]
MFRSFGLPELLIVLAVVLLLFGATRLPKLAGAMGKAVKEFRRSSSTEEKPKARRNSRRRTPTTPAGVPSPGPEASEGGNSRRRTPTTPV